MDGVKEKEVYRHPNRSAAVKQGGQVSKVSGRIMIQYWLYVVEALT